MSAANSPDEMSAQGSSSPSAVAMETRPFAPVCLSCGFPRKGLGNTVVKCPECGAEWARASGVRPWASELDWGLKLLVWSIGTGIVGTALRVSLPATAYSGSTLYSFNVSAWLVLPMAASAWLGARVVACSIRGGRARFARTSSGILLALLVATTTGINERLLGLMFYIGLQDTKAIYIQYAIALVMAWASIVTAASLLGALAVIGRQLGFGLRAMRVGTLASWIAAIGCGAVLVRTAKEVTLPDQALIGGESLVAAFINQVTQTLRTTEDVVTVLLWVGVWLGALVLRHRLSAPSTR